MSPFASFFSSTCMNTFVSLPWGTGALASCPPSNVCDHCCDGELAVTVAVIGLLHSFTSIINTVLLLSGLYGSLHLIFVHLLLTAHLVPSTKLTTGQVLSAFSWWPSHPDSGSVTWNCFVGDRVLKRTSVCVAIVETSYFRGQSFLFHIGICPWSNNTFNGLDVS